MKSKPISIFETVIITILTISFIGIPATEGYETWPFVILFIAGLLMILDVLIRTVYLIISYALPENNNTNSNSRSNYNSRNERDILLENQRLRDDLYEMRREMDRMNYRDRDDDRDYRNNYNDDSKKKTEKLRETDKEKTKK
ncbi:MAG: hypothetical protein HRS57_02100 [Mycoplasmataceae bacterium]|nr:hypothetical protein [Mycoplasmataceae bacterium]